MKRIAKALVIVALASSAATAMAASPFPTPTWPDSYFQSQVFPNIDTYEREHHASALTQPVTGYPSAAEEESSLSAEFPDIQTYQDIHRNDPASVSMASAFPSSVPEEPSMADEGLVPGIVGVAPFVSAQQQDAVGATR